MKGYDYLKKALDGELEPKTIIKTIHTLGELEFNREFDNNYDYYIYQNDNMFHRCNKEGKLGAKYQDRFLNYKVLEKDFEFYCVLEEEKKIPKKLDIKDIYGCDDCQQIHINFKSTWNKFNEIIDYLDYLNSKGDK